MFLEKIRWQERKATHNSDSCPSLESNSTCADKVPSLDHLRHHHHHLIDKTSVFKLVKLASLAHDQSISMFENSGKC